MALSVQNASVKSWTQGTGTLILEQPTGNVTVTCQANINNYTLSIQTKLNGTNAQISGATSVRVYKSNTTTKPSSPTVTLTTNSSGYCSTSVTYLQYYWIEVYNYSGGSWTALASAEQMPYNNVSKVANYYSVTATTGTYTSGASVSHSPVLSGTSVTFTATKGSATGYTYSDTITWTGTLTSFTSTSGQASAGKQITAQTTMDATCTRTANKYSLTVRADNIRITYGGTNYNDEAVINNITYGSSVSFTYTVLNSATYSGANIKYNNNSTSQNYTKSGTTITFTMPAGNSVLFIGASTIDTEEDLLQVKYNTNTQLSYLASKYSLTNATSSVDGSIVFNLSTASNYWRVNASTVDENASGYSSVYLASTVGGVNFTSNFVLEQRKIEMYTYYAFTLSKGTGVASTSPASIIRVRRAAGSSASENTKTVTINPSTGYGRTYSHSLSPTGTCTTSLSGNVLTISNATADATITFTSTKLQYTVTFYANGHGTAPSAYVGVEYGSTISEPTAPSALGYTFGGWYKESACTNAWNFSTDTVTSNRNLYAKWTAQNFTLTIRSEGITLRYNNTNYSNGSTVSIPAGTSVSMTYTLDDMYDFSGAEIWYNSSQHITCGNTGSAITFTMPTYATTLMAGGTSSEGVSASIRYNEAKSLTYTTANFNLSNAMAEADGSLVYTITGTGTYWTVSASTAPENTQGISTVKLKSGSYISTFALEELLVYMSTYYTVTITKGTGIASYTPAITRMQRNSSTTLTVTYSTGYGRTLTATDSNNKCTLSTNVSTKKVTISAVVGDCAITLASAKLQYTVSFVSSNTAYGTVSTASVANVDYGTVLSTSGNKCTCGSTTVTATPTTDTAQYDYAFSSWTNGTATITANTTVTATFTRTLRTYTVTPKVNTSGYGTVTPSTAITGVPYGTTISNNGKVVTLTNGGTTVATITAQEATDTAQYDYSFSSWTNGTGTVTSAKDITANFTRTLKSYTVSFAMQGHGTQVSSQTINYGGTVTQPTAPTALGYTFGGWYKESSCTNAWNFSTDTITGTRTLYAKWTAQNFTLSIRTQGLTVKYNNTTYANGSSVSIPAGTSVTMTYTLNEDYVYSGAEIWYNTNQHVTCGHSGSSITFTMPTYNTTLLAGATFQEESIAYISYNEAYSLTSYPTASFSLTNAIYPGDGSTIFTITGTGTYWTVSADQSAEDTTGYASVYLKSGSYVSTFVLETLTVTMHTSYTITVQPNNTNYGTVSPTSWTARRGSTFSVSSNTFSCGGRTCTATAKSATAQYTYAFSSWSGVPSGGLTGNVTITANFSATTRTYTVTFTRNNSSYGTLSTYSVANVPYGTTLSTNGSTCTCNGTTVTATPASPSNDYTYSFSSWTNGTAQVTGALTVTANFSRATRYYRVSVGALTYTGEQITPSYRDVTYGSSASFTLSLKSSTTTVKNIDNSVNNTLLYTYSGTESLVVIDNNGYTVPWTTVTDGDDPEEQLIKYKLTSSLPTGTKVIHVANAYQPEQHYATITVNLVPHTRQIYYSGSGTAPGSAVTLGNTFSIMNVHSAGTVTDADICILAGTQITMADGTKKLVEEVGPNDQLLSYNPYTKQPCTTTVLACEPYYGENEYYHIDIGDNKYLDVVGFHGLWDTDEKFVINYPMINKNGINTLNSAGERVSLTHMEKVTTEEPIVAYHLLTSLGLYYTNDILSAHRSKGKVMTLGQKIQNLDDEIIEVFNQDYSDCLTWDNLKHTPEYAEAHALYKEEKKPYHNIIMSEFLKLGVDIKAIAPYTPDGKRINYYKAILEEYPNYIGQSSTLDEAMEARNKIEEKWTQTKAKILNGLPTSSAELFRRCYERDLAIEPLIREEDFTFEE